MTTLTAEGFQFAAHDTVVRFEATHSDDVALQAIRSTRQFHQRALLEDVGRRLPEHACVVDVNAGAGNHTVFFSRIVGASTIAIEADRSSLRTLRNHVELNDLGTRVEVQDCTPGASSNIEARTRSIDDIVGHRQVSLVRFGAERLSPAAVQGALRTLVRCRPWVLIEDGAAALSMTIDSLLRPLGYRIVRRYEDTSACLLEAVDVRAGAADAIRAGDRARLPHTTQVVAGMATVAGNELALRATVVSLLPQIDRLYLYLNGFTAAPRFVAENPKIIWTLDPDGKRYGDAGKFWGLPQAKDAIYLTCDDDITYPPDFVASMIRELAALDGRAIVGVHGSLVLQPCAAYYEMKGRAVFNYEHALMRRRQVHIAATNSAVFHSSVVTMTLADFEQPNMAAIWLAKFARSAKLPAYVVPRPDRWLTSLEVTRPTIYQESVTRTGSAYDSSRHQDRVLATLYPLSIARADQADRPVATFLVAHSAKGLADAIEAARRRDRDPIVFVLDESDSDLVRQAAHQVRFQCEIHVIRSSDGPETRRAIEGLLTSAAEVRVFEVRVSSTIEIDGNAWRKLLAAPPAYSLEAQHVAPKAAVVPAAKPMPPTPPRAGGPFQGSARYWESRYATGGNSGAGSYSFFAEFKAEVLNAFVAEQRVQTVIEFGSGDGHQLSLATYPAYLGFDVSDTAIAHCRKVFAADPSRRFLPADQCAGHRADLSMSLDVIFHLVEDNVFDLYMRNLFAASLRYVVIYASDRDDNSGKDGPHVRHRHFSKWIAEHAPQWRLLRHVPNKYPYHGDHTKGSFAEFFFYEKA
ncbi:hypothetical protein BH11PSE9_BH11PSE9_14700 [soil metagenome]